MNTEKTFNYIQSSNLFRLNGKQIDITRLLDILCDAILEEKETNWYIGECTDFTLDELIVGAYWSYSDCHAGQASDSYATLCKLGTIFSPNMSSLESENESVKFVYDQICKELLKWDNLSNTT